jgi:hypothetical protein
MLHPIAPRPHKSVEKRGQVKIEDRRWRIEDRLRQMTRFSILDIQSSISNLAFLSN